MGNSENIFRLIFKGFDLVFEPGFILCDPERLDDFCCDKTHGTDLLARFDSTDAWENICQQGIMACIFDAVQSEYTLIVRHADADAYLQNPPLIVSSGWILGTETGQLVLANLNTLMFWEPYDGYEYDNNYNKCEKLTIQPGWYKVAIQGGINSKESEEEDEENDEEWVFEFVLTPVQELPHFEADLSTSSYFHQRDQISDSSLSIAESEVSHTIQPVERTDEPQVDKNLLLTLLPRLNTTAFESFIIELFNDRNEPFQRIQEIDEPVFKQPLLDSYGDSLESAFLLHYLPLEIFRDFRKINVSEDPLIVQRLTKIRDHYKGKVGHFGFVSEAMVKAAKLRSVAILTNIGNLDKDYYQSTIIPQYSNLAKRLQLYVSAFLVGSYDSFLDLNAGGTREAFQRFLNNYNEGISIRLDQNSAFVSRFMTETILEGVLKGSKQPCEPLFADILQKKEHVLSEFEALIRSEALEDKLEEFLVSHFQDIFGTNYDRIETQIWLRLPDLDISQKSRRFDVFLRNGVMNDWELFEIKRVVPLTRTYRDIPVIKSEVIYAVQQIKNYARLLSQDSVKKKFAKQGIEYYEPSLNLVVGKTPQISHEQWRWLQSSDKDVKILTFNNLFDQMKRRIEDRLAFLKNLK